MKRQSKKNIVTLLVHNNPRVLMKISSLVARKGYNIKTLSCGRTKRSDMAQITAVLESKNDNVDILQKQLYKVIETVKVLPIEPEKHIIRELTFIKVKSMKIPSSELTHLVKLFEGKIIDTSGNNFIVELTGDAKKIDSFINAIGKDNVIDIVSSGVVAIDKLKKGGN